MAKNKNKEKKPVTSTVAAWTKEMQFQFPNAFARFEDAMKSAGFSTTGHMFGQLSKAKDFITTFLVECEAPLPDDFKNVEQVKLALALAFENGQPFENWKAEVQQRYPTAFQSLMVMLRHNSYPTIELALAGAQHIAGVFVSWMRSGNVVACEEKVAVDQTYLKAELERALANSEAISRELAW